MVIEGESVHVEGSNLWDHRWVSLQAHLELSHPSYPNQHHRMDIYQIETDQGNVVFAAGELSANVCGFYLPESC